VEDRRAEAAAASQAETGSFLTRAARIGRGMRTIGPGLAAAVAVALAARLITSFLPSIVAEVSVALLLGIVVASLAGPRIRALTPGLAFSAQRILRLGIVLLGARLSLAEIARIGLPATGLIVITMVVSFAIVLLAARFVRVEPRLAVLIAVGSAVCGNTAIVTLFGTLAVFLYPTIGRAVDLSQVASGLWAGVAVHDTSQVIATGAAFGPEALDVATVVKLIRNALMAPLLLLIAAVWAARAETVAAPGDGTTLPGAGPGDANGTPGLGRRGIRRAIPLFVVGFLALATLRTLGLIDAAQAGALDTVARGLILVALAAVGMSIHIGELRETSWRPLAVGFAVALMVGLGSLALIVTLDLGSAIGR
jgi:uncharacterized membrane protein YadS